MDSQIDETLNIGSEVRLAEDIVKNVKIGSIGLIRNVRQVMKITPYKFSTSIGRDKWPATEDRNEVDWPAIEAAYREAFNLVLVDGLSEDEYERVDDKGIKELDTLLDRFL
ncbi:hypothetical protein M2444_005364 [Paenibacillus sp. PastF-3]|uniref:hypothetical protein n=1 Tax=Paenibacillus sp. PastF-3 TaxID=2940626 RepID=UPI002474BD6A|nr:hypothetical protein [Paenibacillus sp. PastF-3]MDH6373532.1 hypothetical protein [Paenibacillus sp. PastF-3]